MLGPAPVVDFDGTLASLPVPWAELRAQLGVQRIDDLWVCGAGDEGWAVVTRAEWEAAAVATPVRAMVSGLLEARAVGVLSSNSERAVWRFLDRFQDLRAVVAVVVGRETLGGPKQDPNVFTQGFWRCVHATAAARPRGEPVVYVGDQSYELRWARRLGARVVNVDEITSQ